LIAIGRKLRPLLTEVAFVGGGGTALLVSDPGAAALSVNGDVDVIVEIASYAWRRPRAQRILLSAGKLGRPIFFSLIIIVVAFRPVFLLETSEILTAGCDFSIYLKL
jgi:hypothetical protein